MSKKKKSQGYNIEELKKAVKMHTTIAVAEEYNEEKMAIFGANVNLKRHICDLKDGLKPVSRRILMTMYNQKLFYPKVVKSANVVGNLLANYHRMGWLFR